MSQDLPQTRVANLFEPEPRRWGLRGDPFLWREMQEGFRDVPLPVDLSQLALLLAQTFEALTGHPLSDCGSILLERHSHGGISSGGISLEFWRDTAIPLLLSRYPA